MALAEAVAGDVAAFVELMNTRAAELGMDSTTFVNPNGLDASEHLSSARDLIKLGVAALEHGDVLRVARIKHIQLEAETRVLEIDATNRLLGVYPGYLGLKTGDTIAAGQVLLSYTETQHDRIIAVVLGSGGRRIATRELVTWAATWGGPRDQFFAAALGTDTATLFPEWYQHRLGAVLPLPMPGDAGPVRTPLHDDLEARFGELLPALLGGDD